VGFFSNLDIECRQHEVFVSHDCSRKWIAWGEKEIVI